MEKKLKKHNLPFSPDLIAFDFDGVFTDNRVYIDESGKESVVCNRADGLAIDYMKKTYSMVILSTETNPVVAKRGQKLGVEVYQAISDKREALIQLCQKRGIDMEKIVFIGNDINDLGAVSVCGFSLAPSDAHFRMVQTVDHVLASRGGDGVIREFCEVFLGM